MRRPDCHLSTFLYCICRRAVVADSAVAAVVVVTFGVVGLSSRPGPGAYELHGSEQLTVNSATFWL
jgi:hypothetical protein